MLKFHQQLNLLLVKVYKSLMPKINSCYDNLIKLLVYLDFNIFSRGDPSDLYIVGPELVNLHLNLK